MLENANFLCEIGTEEIPAGYIPPAIEQARNEFGKKLEEYRIGYDKIDVSATPRRMVIMASGVADLQSEDEVEIKGPSLKTAYDADGKPTRALQGFLKGNGLELQELYDKKTDKGEYIFAKKKMVAHSTKEIIPELVDQLIRTLHFPKKMRWSDKKITFPRPIAYFLILFNDRLIPYAHEGISSTNSTRGHYIQHNRMIEISSVAEYESVLKASGVTVDHRERRSSILAALEKAAKALKGNLVSDEELLETVCFLTEDPVVVTCGFGSEYLEIPDIVLITEMKEHQKYFAVRDRNGKLLPNFLVVSNNPATDHVKAGNERVIRARFNDARFFFNEDTKSSLYDKVESLNNVLFHKELGTIYQKTERIGKIAEYLSGMFSCTDTIREKIQRAALLCKADLNTAMVFEFTSLQGKIGRVYALLDGEDPEVADAIDDHYKPRFQNDPLPRGLVSVVVSLAEKVDNLFGSFSVGNIPTGSQDPYALRRQASAVVEMLMASNLHLDMGALLQKCAPMYKQGSGLIDKILAFISARANTIYMENGLRYDEIDACMATQYFDYLELYRRAKSLNEFRSTEGFTEMLLSFKRMNNIVSAFRQKNPDYILTFKKDSMKEDTEKALFNFFDSRRATISECIEKNDYTTLFRVLIEGKGIVDAFFDKVMVMAEDMELRDTRLALLDSILDPFRTFMDFSKISE